MKEKKNNGDPCVIKTRDPRQLHLQVDAFFFFAKRLL